jgi:hypothetical protein
MMSPRCYLYYKIDVSEGCIYLIINKQKYYIMNLDAINILRKEKGLESSAHEEAIKMYPKPDIIRWLETETDEYGCVYDMEGKRLLRLENPADIEYCKIREGIEVIGGSVFSCCRRLKSVILPQSLKSIGIGAFKHCESLESIKFPSSLEIIYHNAFEGCTSLKYVVFSDTMKGSIGSFAFEGCTSLKHVVFPITMKGSIGSFAFKDCKSLRRIVLPEGIDSLGCKPFPNGIELVLKSNYFAVEDGLLIDTEYGSLIQCVSEKFDVVVPDNVRVIADYAFSDCTMLRSVTLPKRIMKIGKGAFKGSKNLQDVTIPTPVDMLTGVKPSSKSLPVYQRYSRAMLRQRLSEIKEFTFEGCTSLQTIILPSSIIRIESSAFRGCKLLQSIVFTSLVEEIGIGAFDECDALQTIFVGKDRKEYYKELLGRYKGYELLIESNGQRKLFKDPVDMTKLYIEEI